MDATLLLSSLTRAYTDSPSTNNPLMKPVDWASQMSVAVSNAKTESYRVAPGQILSVFTSLETTAIDDTTQLTFALSTLASDRYRFTWTAGTAPVLRTDRVLASSGKSITVTVNTNQTATFASTGALFTSVIVSDLIFIHGTSTGDSAGPFNPMNEGWWVVIATANDNNSVQVARLPGVDFSAFGETVSVTANSQFIAYSAEGVQVGDQVNLSAGFSAPVMTTFTIAAVTPTWFEVVSSLALPVSDQGIPGVGGINFYTAAKRYVRILADRDCVPRFNGDTGATNRISPWSPGDATMMAELVKTGPSWILTVQNVSQQPMNLIVISAE